MKRFPLIRLNFKIASLCAFLVAMMAVANLNAQSVYLTFSGGGGTPLVITWTTPISYTITATPVNHGKDPYFVFDEVGNVYSNTQYSSPQFVTSGAPTYTGVDGTFAINNISSGENFNSITPNDIKFRNVPDAGTTELYTGESFALTAGTLTTTVNYSGTMPTDGYYNTFITDASYVFMGSGSAVPEPSTYAVLMGLATLGLTMWRRRRTRMARDVA